MALLALDGDEYFTITEEKNLTKPSFAVAWAASQRIYSPDNPAEKVAQVIGRAVEINIRLPKDKNP